MNIATINRVMPLARGNYKLVKEDYSTNDIIHLIVKVHDKCLKDTIALAQSIPGKSVYEYTRNLYTLVKDNIGYKLDPPDAQYVKSPAQVWTDKYADCKSYSLFIATVLENRGIPYKYRFTSYNKSHTPTHVYVIVPLDNFEKNGLRNYITLDAVMPGYNQEKPYSFKRDIEMKKGLHFVSGIGNAQGNSPIKPVKDIKFDLGGKDITELSDGELDLLIAKDQLETRQAIVNGLRGIGTQQAEKYQDKIDVIDDALEVIDDFKHGRVSAIGMLEEIGMIGDDAENGEYNLAPLMAGIGNIGAKKAKRKEKKKARKEKRKERKKEIKAIKKSGGSKKEKRKAIKKVRAEKGSKTGKFLRKAAKTAAKGAKAIVKVATLPQRMAIKGALELQLPKASPFFLYLFVNDQATIKKLPNKVRRKRKKAEQLADFIVNVVGMKRKHFMGIVRNGIMKHYGKTPENVIAEQMKGKIKGLGDGGVIGFIIKAVVALVKLIAKAFKKKGPDISQDDSPEEGDWDEVTNPESFKSEQLVDATKGLVSLSKKTDKKNTRLQTRLAKLNEKVKKNPNKAKAIEKINAKLDILNKSGGTIKDSGKLETVLNTFAEFIDNSPEDPSVNPKQLEREIKSQPENVTPLTSEDENQFDSGGRSIWDSFK